MPGSRLVETAAEDGSLYRIVDSTGRGMVFMAFLLTKNVLHGVVRLFV